MIGASIVKHQNVDGKMKGRQKEEKEEGRKGRGKEEGGQGYK